MFLRIATCYTCTNLYTFSATATYNVVNVSAQPVNPWIVLQMFPTCTSTLERLVSLHKPCTWSHISGSGSYGQLGGKSGDDFRAMSGIRDGWGSCLGVQVQV